MIHPERRRENLKKIEEMDNHDTEPLQPVLKTWCMNKKVDMVEVVRCKNCKYCGSEIRDGIKFTKCELKHNWMPQADWFCADGERR